MCDLFADDQVANPVSFGIVLEAAIDLSGQHSRGLSTDPTMMRKVALPSPRLTIPEVSSQHVYTLSQWHRFI